MRTCPSCGHANPDDARFCNACATELTDAGVRRETRRTVTVVFCDVTGSTALGERTDPETLRRVMTRYFETMRSVIESHGGSVEKFIGDAVMAVFGVPQVHEDDALRAVRAAAGMRAALADLNRDLGRDPGVTIDVRIGVNTGEVMAATEARGDNVVTGDTVNTAARLQQAAGSGEILIGDATYRLVRDAVVVDDVDPLGVKGKSARVRAHRLLEVRPGAPGHARRMDSPMVGRDRPLRLLRETFEGVVGDRACALFTVLGPAGIGKTRLTREFLDGVGDAPTVLAGRALPYGDGITFWPIKEMLDGIAGIGPSDGSGHAVDRIRRVLPDTPDAERIATHLAGVIGADVSTPQVEATWAVRRLFETLAISAPVIAFFDDVHWAEPALLDVIEHVADFSRDAPILILCTARPEFFDLRPAWGGGKLRATTAHLEPLDDRESEELIGNLLSHPALSSEIRVRIRDAAQGNPLFVEEMLQMLLDDGSIMEKDDGWAATVDLATVHVPPAIAALLAARLDRLSADERETIEAASIAGEIVERAAIHELTPGRASTAVDDHLSALVRKDLIVPNRWDPSGRDAFRFRHLLIRDAAYAGLPKERRAELHRTFARWLEDSAGGRAGELDEVVGYHLEQAHTYLAELGSSHGIDAVAEQGGASLWQAGLRARARGDVGAAVSLLSRSARLQRRSPERVDVLIALMDAAQELIDHETIEWATSEVLADAEALGNEALLLRARVAAAWARVTRDDTWTDLETASRNAIQRLGAIGDDRGLTEAWRAIAWTAAGRRALYADGTEAAMTSAEHARRIGDRGGELSALAMQLGWMTWGPMPVGEVIERCDALLPDVEDSRWLQSEVAIARASAEGMRGRVEASRLGLANAVSTFEDLGQSLNVAFSTQNGWLVEWLAGDYAAAESWMRRSLSIMEAQGNVSLSALHRLMMAQAIAAQGRLDEAGSIAVEHRSTLFSDDPGTGQLWRRVLAIAAAGGGDVDEAQRLSREAIELAERTDGLFDHAWALIERSDILRSAGRDGEASDAAAKAVALAERKEDVVTAAKARERL